MAGVTGIQACSEDVSSHLNKLLFGYIDKKGKVWPPNPYLPIWLKAGNRFFIWGWRLRKNEGKKASYQLREIEFLIQDEHVIHREVPHEGV